MACARTGQGNHPAFVLLPYPFLCAIFHLGLPAEEGRTEENTGVLSSKACLQVQAQ